MDGAFPQSPDLSSYAPRSPEISDLSGLGSPRFTNSNFGQFNQQQRFQPPQYQPNGFGGAGAYQPTSIPQQQYPPYPQQQYQPAVGMPPRQVKEEVEDDEYMPDAPVKRSRRVKQEPSDVSNGMAPAAHSAPPPTSTEDPTLGCQLNTSFPVARIKRIMQADEDIGKVAQVTPTVVSRALELFMIKLISSSAHQARGTGSGGSSKGPKRVLQQHLKKAVQADEKFDFLNEIVDKVPDAPTKSKKENGSDSEDAKPKKKGKKRKDSGDDF
ncbi:hypothetical protein PRZ48_005901 [Zasmidium cellare]|uniref:Transcription factor CBF/NF-Y/archaeal histone domain-containing protein n=1 Tax=Zasmidium cellare TaxID=395010 RepID=A0ABR0EMU1_ZASCE|nr:hypothetical protein PRZ48_005901 [Zasmidium cellare]